MGPIYSRAAANAAIAMEAFVLEAPDRRARRRMAGLESFAYSYSFVALGNGLACGGRFGSGVDSDASGGSA